MQPDRPDILSQTDSRRPEEDVFAGQMAFRARVHSVINLTKGELSGYMANFSRNYEETPLRFGNADPQNLPDVCTWLSRAIKLAFKARQEHPLCDQISGPLFIPAPDCIFQRADATAACEAALVELNTTSEAAPSSICLVFTDAALSLEPARRAVCLQAFRNAGLRLAIDWRKSWTNMFDPSLARLFDAVWVRSELMENEPELLQRVYEAGSAAVPVIADKPLWRDGDMLADCGIHYAINPVPDA